jgi:carbamoyl-phosphate synthase large subunit
VSTISVMVTGVAGGSVGEQIIKSLKMSSLSLKLIGVDSRAISKGFKSVDFAHIVPMATSPDYIPSLIKLCRDYNVQVLFPGSEAELIVIGKNRSKLEAEGVLVPINRQDVIETCLDKNKTMDFILANGFDCPRSVTIRSVSDAEGIDFYPVVIKPSVGGGGSKDILIAQSNDELVLFCTYMLKLYPEFIVQEYIGTTDSEFTVGVIHSLDGDFINSIAVKKSILTALNNRIKIKNRTNNKKLGETLAISSGISEGYIGTYSEVTSVCEKIAKALGVVSAINIQCRFFEGKVYVFEINPRYSGTTSLRALAGYNEPEIMIRKHILNETVEPRFAYKSCYIGRGLEESIIEPLEST